MLICFSILRRQENHRRLYHQFYYYNQLFQTYSAPLPDLVMLLPQHQLVPNLVYLHIHQQLLHMFQPDFQSARLNTHQARHKYNYRSVKILDQEITLKHHMKRLPFLSHTHIYSARLSTPPGPAMSIDSYSDCSSDRGKNKSATLHPKDNRGQSPIRSFPCL